MRPNFSHTVHTSNQYSCDGSSIDLTQRKSLQRHNEPASSNDFEVSDLIKNHSIGRNLNNIYQKKDSQKSIGGIGRTQLENMGYKKDSTKALIKKMDLSNTQMYQSSIVSNPHTKHGSINEIHSATKTRDGFRKQTMDSPMTLKSSVHIPAPNINSHVIKSIASTKALQNELFYQGAMTSKRDVSEDNTESNFNQTETDFTIDRQMLKKDDEIGRLRTELDQIKERANLNMKIVLSKNEEINKLNELIHDKNQKIRQ